MGPRLKGLPVPAKEAMSARDPREPGGPRSRAAPPAAVRPGSGSRARDARLPGVTFPDRAAKVVQVYGGWIDRPFHVLPLRSTLVPRLTPFTRIGIRDYITARSAVSAPSGRVGPCARRAVVVEEGQLAQWLALRWAKVALGPAQRNAAGRVHAIRDAQQAVHVSRGSRQSK